VEGRPPATFRVLVVDDNRDAANSLFLLIRLWGHDVQVTYDSASAFALACSYRPHVVLLDLAMPKVNGYQLARQLRHQEGLREAVLVAVSAYVDEDHRPQGGEAELDFYLAKPVNMEELERLLLVIRKVRHLGCRVSDTFKAGDTMRPVPGDRGPSTPTPT
jgi:DNA-binding response OmpR family regulator